MKNSILSKVFLWMFIGLVITFLTGFYVSINENMLYNIFSSGTYFILIIVEFVLVIVLSARVRKMSPLTAKVMFSLYSFVTGLTFSSIFVVYSLESIMFVFLISAVVFLLFAALGHFTKIDLSKLSTFLLMALIGVLLCTIINMFLGNSTFDIIITCISLLIFIGFTAYDIQKIKYYDTTNSNFAIIGALELYLDFINIFLDLLRLFGKSRD